MHIAFVVPRFYPCKGGYENYVLSVAQSARGVGHRVSVFTSTALDLESFWVEGCRTLAAGDTTFDGITIRRFPISYGRWHRYPRRLLALLPDWRLKAHFARPAFFVDGLAHALREAGADVIHVGPLPYHSLMFMGVAEARRRGIPVLATPCTHFGEEESTEVSRHYVQDFQIKTLNCCDKVLTLTRVEAAKLEKLGVAPEKLVFSGAGIDPSQVTGGDGELFRKRHAITEPIVLHLGMRAADKGSICVVQAMKLLWSRGILAHLVVAGPSLAAFDRFLNRQPGIDKQMLVLGPVSDAEKNDLLAAATVVVQPSRVESLGLIALEAWANQKPVIAADIAVSRELIEPGRDGLLVPFGNESALADAIAALLDDPVLRDRMGEAGRQKVLRRFSGSRIVENILPLFSTSPTI